MNALMELSNDIHRFIILEVLLKTLERDQQYLNVLKMGDVFTEWYTLKNNETFEEFKNVKSKLNKAGCKIEKVNNDGVFTEYMIVIRGKTDKRTYSNIALRKWVREELKRLLNMSYQTPGDRK
ncbi:hypothetical protein MKZ17_12635 [Solibacillus sp. FSL R7-0682]|uniref:hypothetical protein n=1 Tax=Solibacillus sp. FSL R7-0682 TaxID=2921690 RepID=UPI0030F7A377